MINSSPAEALLIDVIALSWYYDNNNEPVTGSHNKEEFQAPIKATQTFTIHIHIHD